MIVRAVLAVDVAPQQKKLHRLLEGLDAVVDTVKRRDRLWEHISRQSGDIIVVSRALIPEPAVETIELLAKLPDSPDVVVVSEQEDHKEESELIAAGCAAVVHPRLSDETLGDLLKTVIMKRGELATKRIAADRSLAEPRLSDFVSQSPAMQRFMNVVTRVVASDTPLLFLGETGVGKERLARAIHAESPRSEGPFVAVNCGALPDALLESELFGHEEGAFTGASRARRGWFELAHKGTVFLDEVADLPYHLQVKLLRVLQEHEIQPIGSEKTITIDVRVMAATNRQLEQDVQEDRFRRDLFYRLSVVTLTVPPLRERAEDIPDLVQSYIAYFRSRITTDVTAVSPAAMEALVGYPWPGNVRELMNVVERALLLCNGREIALDDLPAAISGRPAVSGAAVLPVRVASETIVPEEWLDKPWREVKTQALRNLERAYLMGLLKATEGRIGQTAQRAGIQTRSLFDKMKAYGLRKEDFKPRKDH